MPCGDANVKYPRAGRPGRARDSRREPVRSLARAGTFLYVARAVQTALERWPRGRRRRFAKPLYGPKAVSRVRIPPSPLMLAGAEEKARSRERENQTRA